MAKIATIKGNSFFLNFFGLVLFFVLYLPCRVLSGLNSYHEFRGKSIFILLLIIFILVILHELIHVFTALLFTKIQNISLHFKVLVIECRVKSLLTRNQYILYAGAPAILMTLVCVVTFFLFESMDVKIFMTLLIPFSFATGGGDFWFIYKAMKFPKEYLFLDNGLLIEVYDKEEQTLTKEA